MKPVKILLLAAAVWSGLNSALAQTWTQTSAPTNLWTCVASSADGSKLAAGEGNNNFYGLIYVSTNSGLTWIQTSAPSNYWTSIASSADGNTLYAVSAYYSFINPGIVYSSTNEGTSWNSYTIQTPGDSGHNWAPRIACSADGSKAVTTYYGGIYSTTNSGAIWTSNSVPQSPFADPNWHSIICSSD